MLFAALLLLAAAGISYSAPSEENIGPSPALAVTAPDSSDVSRPTVPNENAGARQAELESDIVSRPRASFPYAIRSGDTLGSVAATFGVPLDDLMRANHLDEDSALMIGQTLRIPNPFEARERELSTEIDRLSTEKQAADERLQKAQDNISQLRAQLEDSTASNNQYGRDLRALPWWRAATVAAAAAAAVGLGIMLLALIEWFMLRGRYRAVAEMNESLRRLDYKYRAALAKAELRFQELYGHRRRGLQDGQERSKTPEETEIEQLNRQLKDILERHLSRLGRAGNRAGGTRWRERLRGIGSPVEARPLHR